MNKEGDNTKETKVTERRNFEEKDKPKKEKTKKKRPKKNSQRWAKSLLRKRQSESSLLPVFFSSGQMVAEVCGNVWQKPSITRTT